MSVRSLFAILGALALLGLLAACEPAILTPCTYETIDRPVMISPAWDAVVDSLTPTFTWTHADADCPADHFLIYLSVDEMAVADRLVVPYTATGGELILPDVLRPGTTYYWAIFPVVSTSSGDVEGPPGEAVVPFNTGPRCTGAETLLPPDLLSPADGALIHLGPADGFAFYWDDPLECIPGPYTLEISPDPDFATIYTFPGDVRFSEMRTSMGVYSDAYFAFMPCTLYYWRVQHRPESGDPGPFSPVWHFTIDAEVGGCGPEGGELLAEVLTDAVCRSGPGLDYPIVEYLPAGGEWTVIGRNADRTWWLIRLNDGRECWVAEGVILLTGDPYQVPGVQAPPPPVTPTPVPVNCAQYNYNPNACMADQACQWLLTQQHPNGECVNR